MPAPRLRAANTKLEQWETVKKIELIEEEATVANGLMTAPKYFPSIEAEFKEQGIPVEITRLAFVESSFNLMARSKVGASAALPSNTSWKIGMPSAVCTTPSMN